MSFYNAEMDNAGYQKQKQVIKYVTTSDITVFDVGANIGQSIERYISIIPNCTIFAFEPHPNTFTTLYHRHGSSSHIHCEELALSEYQGIAPLYATNLPEVSSLLRPEPFVADRSPKRNYDYHTVQVKVDTLDCVSERLGIEHINILKLDVQGLELSVLRGASKLLRSQKIDIIYSEVMFAENYIDQCDCNDLWNYLKTFKYSLMDLHPFLYTDSGRLWAGNAIFISSEILGRMDPR